MPIIRVIMQRRWHHWPPTCRRNAASRVRYTIRQIGSGTYLCHRSPGMGNTHHHSILSHSTLQIQHNITFKYKIIRTNTVQEIEKTFLAYNLRVSVFYFILFYFIFRVLESLFFQRFASIYWTLKIIFLLVFYFCSIFK